MLRSAVKQKKTSILSAISRQGKKLRTMKTFPRFHVLKKVAGGINAVNIRWSKSVNSFFVIEKTFIILKIDEKGCSIQTHCQIRTAGLMGSLYYTYKKSYQSSIAMYSSRTNLY